MEPWNKSSNFIFPTKHVIPKSLKFSHWPSKYCPTYIRIPYKIYKSFFQVGLVGCLGPYVSFSNKPTFLPPDTPPPDPAKLPCRRHEKKEPAPRHDLIVVT